MGTGKLSADAKYGDECNEPATDSHTIGNEMDQYNINFEEWMLQNQDSKIITNLPMPGYEPLSRKNMVIVLQSRL